MDPEGGRVRVGLLVQERSPKGGYICPSGSSCTGAVPGRRWDVPAARPQAEVGGVCSMSRALLCPWLLQPVGLMVRGGRAMPPGCFYPEGSAICVCYGRLPSHISRRRARSLSLIVTRWLERADEAQKSSIYISDPSSLRLGEVSDKA